MQVFFALSIKCVTKLWRKEGNFMLEMKLNGVKKFMEATLVVNNITFEAYEGDKVGIVGANGSGKSTILKLIAGIEPDALLSWLPANLKPWI